MSDINSIKVLYFASLGEEFGIAEEHLTIPRVPFHVSSLKKLLSARGEQWKNRLQASNILCAVNQEVQQGEDIQLNPGDEIAFFPPVTGG
ncbi:molybdopterin synthase subunit MoaD [Alteromonadaceae bacterium Bs31]|nr:molybdopterin synthase subunit MoaD [Alteromonadaceae bacterium Bs31]